MFGNRNKSFVALKGGYDTIEQSTDPSNKTGTIWRDAATNKVYIDSDEIVTGVIPPASEFIGEVVELEPTLSNQATTYPDSSLWFHDIYKSTYIGDVPLQRTESVDYGDSNTIGVTQSAHSKNLARILINTNSTGEYTSNVIQNMGGGITSTIYMNNPSLNDIVNNTALERGMWVDSGKIYGFGSVWCDNTLSSYDYSMDIFNQVGKYREKSRQQSGSFIWSTSQTNNMSNSTYGNELLADFVMQVATSSEDGLTLSNSGTGKNVLEFENYNQNSPFVIRTVEESHNSLYNESLEISPKPVGSEVMKGIRIGCLSESSTPTAKVSLMCGFQQDFLPSDAIRIPANECMISGVNSVNTTGFLGWPTCTPLYDNMLYGFNVYNDAFATPRTLRDGVGWCIRTEFGTVDRTSICCGQETNNAESVPYPRIKFKHENYDVEFMTKALFKNSTNATSETDAAITTTGGIAITKDLFIKGEKLIMPNMNTPASNTATSLVFKDNNSDYLTTPASILTSDYDSILYYSSSLNRICVHASSQRYKTAIEDVNPNYSNFLLNINLKTYKLVDQSETEHKRLTGLIAEELYDLDPKSVAYKYHSEEEVRKNKWEENVIKRNKKVPNKPCKLINQPREDYLLYALIQQNQIRAEENAILQESLETYQMDNLRLVEILKNLSKRVGALERHKY